MSWRKYAIKTMLQLSGDKTWQYYQQALALRSADNSTLKSMQQEKLDKLLRHCSDKVPYYKELFSTHDLCSNGKFNLDNIGKLPTLTKDIIREQKDSLLASDHTIRGTYSNTSGGSTGEPVQIIQDKQYDQWNTANKLFFNHALGKEPGDAEIKFWGSDRDIITGSLGTKEKIINYIYNRRFFNSYNLDSDRLKQLVELNNKFKPTAYWAYMEAALELAKYINDVKCRFISPEFIISTIAPLTEHNRQIIQSNLNCPVYNQYGSREVGAIACECARQDGLHSFPWTHFIEIVDDNNEPVAAGTPGKILVTTLENYSMPLIRYEIGDIGIESVNSECGFGSFTIEQIIGRTLGYFKKNDGTLKHSHFIVQALFYHAWIKKFQIIQKDYNEILIKTVINKEQPEPAIKDLEKIEKLIIDFMDNSCKVNFEFVDDIPVSDSGKHLYTICQC